MTEKVEEEDVRLLLGIVHNPPPPKKKNIYIYIVWEMQFPVFWASKRALERLTDGIQGLLATRDYLQSPPPIIETPTITAHFD